MGPNTQIPGTISSGTIASGPTPPPKKPGLFGRKPSRTGSRRPAAANTIPTLPPAPQNDIVLAPEPSARKKPNWMLIVIIAAGVLVIAGIIAAVVIANSSDGKKKGTSTPAAAGTVSAEAVREKFTPYYNYLVYGADTADGTAPSTDNWYYNKIIKEGFGAEYLKKYAGELTDRFIDFYNSAVGIKSNELSEINLANYKDMFYASTEYLLIDSQDKNSVNDKIFTQSYDFSTTVAVFEYAKKYLESDTSDMRAYKNFNNTYSILYSMFNFDTTKINSALGGDNGQ